VATKEPEENSLMILSSIVPHPHLSWLSDLYVKELLSEKKRLEALEAKEQEIDHKIHVITTENHALK